MQHSLNDMHHRLRRLGFDTAARTGMSETVGAGI